MNARERLARLEAQCAQLEAERDELVSVVDGYRDANMKLSDMVKQVEYERDKLRAQAEYCWKDRAERGMWRDQCRQWEQRWKDVERCLRLKDDYRTALEVIAAAVRDPLATWQDLTRVLQDQLQELGFDTTQEDDE